MASAACLPVTTRSSSGPADGGSQSLLSQAEAAYAQGQFGPATDYYRQFLAGEPESPRLEAVWASYGLAAEKAGRFEEAALAYERLLNLFPAGEFAGEARFRLVSVHLAAGKGAAAEELAGQLLAAETDPRRRADLGLALGRARWLNGKYREAAENFLEVWKQKPGQARREAARNGVLGSLARLDYQNLAAIQQSSGRDFPGPEATYLLLYQTAAAGHQDHAGAMADYFRLHYSESPLLPQAEAVVQALAAKASLPAPAFGAGYDPRAEMAAILAPAPPEGGLPGLGLPPGGVTLAVLLPLSDKKGASQFAREVSRGLELAVKELAPGRVGLTVLDTGGSPDQAARHFAQVAADPLVLAVVGPILREEAAAAAEAAGRTDLPLMVISQAPDLPRLGPNIFRLFLTPGHQAEALARHAVRTRNHQALGVVYPDDNYGRVVWSAFQAEATRLGARVTVTDSYSPKNPDLEAVAARLTGGKAARRVSTDYQAKMDCTVMYLPDSPGPVAQFLPLLAFHDVTRMPFLGSSLWLDDPNFLAGSARYLQGAVIPAPLSDLSQRPESRRFFDSFTRAYGHAPGQFAAYGYDAGQAIIRAMGQGAGSREALRQTLALGGQTPGATGPFSFDQNGEYQVEPALLTIQERDFVLLREPGPFVP
ncbi:MAG: penicillin-binding protein activator [Candidatus Adiutrix sp.]|jgi:branched-chain amino acid transport system substrate-binding protein|nr:penicillin-binding protein activator [Candidatus Adiutrix sp.]